jgi:hypothetical protein
MSEVKTAARPALSTQVSRLVRIRMATLGVATMLIFVVAAASRCHGYGVPLHLHYAM